jgi:hypothetical protein
MATGAARLKRKESPGRKEKKEKGILDSNWGLPGSLSLVRRLREK